MANFTPNWNACSGALMSAQNLMQPYTVGANPSYSLGVEPSFQYVEGFDASLGIGQFVYGQASAGVTAGAVCEVTQTLQSSGSSVALVSSFQPWQGTANSGKTLAVALATLTAAQFGWFQVYGAALVNTSAAVAVGAAAYFNSTAGVIQSGAVASKQMLSAVCLVASNASFGQAQWTSTGTVTPALPATQAIYLINGPVAQGAIT